MNKTKLITIALLLSCISSMLFISCDSDDDEFDQLSKAVGHYKLEMNFLLFNETTKAYELQPELHQNYDEIEIQKINEHSNELCVTYSSLLYKLINIKQHRLGFNFDFEIESIPYQLDKDHFLQLKPKGNVVFEDNVYHGFYDNSLEIIQTQFSATLNKESDMIVHCVLKKYVPSNLPK